MGLIKKVWGGSKSFYLGEKNIVINVIFSFCLRFEDLFQKVVRENYVNLY